MSFDPELFGQAMGEAIRKAVDPLYAEIESLQCKLSLLEGLRDGKDGRDGIDGKDCDMEQVRAMVEENVKAIPAPENGKDGKDGVDGRDGKSITLDDVQTIIEKAVALICDDAEKAIEEYVKAIPAPKDGTSITLEDVSPLINQIAEELRDRVGASIDDATDAAEEARRAAKEAVDKAQSLRQPENGKDGRDGADGKDGEKGEKGNDGTGMADLLIDRDGALIATYTDGRLRSLGQVVGKDGRDGKDGVDGIGLDNFELEYLPETHEIAIKAQAGIRVKEIRYPAGGIQPGGYWRDNTEAKAGQVWTHDGSAWISCKNTKDAPSTQSDDWLLVARKGRDGERGPRGKDGTPPAPIKLNGEDDAGND